jgi:hypothetical protein
MSVAELRHALALLIAIALVFGIHLQAINLQPLLGNFDQRYFENYTPYFPGLNELDTHEIFAPKNASKKKIVFLGASAVDSIGCDTTWQDRRVSESDRNVHYTCSVSAQFNQLLAEKGLSDWKSFDLARNGTKLTPMLYVYSRIMALHPEIIVWGEGYNYYLWENADAAALTPSQYAYMDEVFGHYDDTAAIWNAYKANLKKHGWTQVHDSTPVQAPVLSAKYRTSTSVADLLVRALSGLRTEQPFPGPSRPLVFAPDLVNWNLRPTSVSPHPFQNDDPDFSYFQGFQLLAEMQKHDNGKMFFFFTPKYFESADPYFVRGVTDVFGGQLTKYGIPFANHIDLPLKPIYETVDGYHGSVFGNRKIAEAVFNDLEKARLLP